MIISLDTETTGLDLRHGARPFLVTTCDEEGENTWWEWPVDPLTRKVRASRKDLREIQSLIKSARLLVLQNPKYDYAGLKLLFADEGMELRWDWGKVRDTLLAGHLLASNQPHDLTTMTLVYLDVNVQPYEDRVKAATQAAIREVKRLKLPWRLAKRGLPEMPSAKESVWKADMWIGRALADHLDLPEDHEYRVACPEYANSDSSVTLPLFLRQHDLLEGRGLMRIYEERLKILPIVTGMEERGVTLSRKRLLDRDTEFKKKREETVLACKKIAQRYDYDLVLPKSGNNRSLSEFVFGEKTLGLPALSYGEKSGAPSLTKDVLDVWENSLEEGSDGLEFVRSLLGKRKLDTAINYMEGYQRFWVPLRGDTYVLFPSLNPTGTTTLRWSSNNPNEQNISKKKGYNLRYCLGPAPGREWWSLDYQNLELRIPSFEAGEEAAIDVFEHPERPPYHGSYHLLVCGTLYPKEFSRFGAGLKDELPSLYHRVKCGNFAVIYGAQEGTADHTYGVPGAYRKIRKRLPKIAALSDRMLSYARKTGYVETIPDRTVDPSRGYPLMCGMLRGKVSPTVPLNYHIQGTAMWLTTRAMVRCEEYLQKRNRVRPPGEHAYIRMQVHDEIVFDFPRAKGPSGNRKAIGDLQRLMQQCGDDIGIPTPVSIGYHPSNWGETGSPPWETA